MLMANEFAATIFFMGNELAAPGFIYVKLYAFPLAQLRVITEELYYYTLQNQLIVKNQ